MSLENMDNDWKKEAPKLAAMGRVNSFSVPEGYFESLQGQINSQAYLSDLHPGNATGKFTVPEGYFEALTAQIEGQIIVEKLKEEYVENHFTVPEGYFSKLQNRITAQIEDAPKVISIAPRKKLAWISYAAAACITIGVSSVLYFNTAQNTVSNTNSVATAKSANLPQIQNLSDDDIISYLKVHSTRADMPVIIENLSNVTTPDVIISDVSDEEAQAYLDKSL